MFFGLSWVFLLFIQFMRVIISQREVNDLIKTIYLAGSICSDEEDFCRSWRKKATERLARKGFNIYNPISDKSLDKSYDPDYIFYTDMKMIEKSDILLVEMTREDYSYIGTSMEIFFAHQKKMPVYIWGNANKKNYFLRATVKKRFDELDHAIAYLETAWGV